MVKGTKCVKDEDTVLCSEDGKNIQTLPSCDISSPQFPRTDENQYFIAWGECSWATEEEKCSEYADLFTLFDDYKNPSQSLGARCVWKDGKCVRPETPSCISTPRCGSIIDCKTAKSVEACVGQRQAHSDAEMGQTAGGVEFHRLCSWYSPDPDSSFYDPEVFKFGGDAHCDVSPRMEDYQLCFTSN